MFCRSAHGHVVAPSSFSTFLWLLSSRPVVSTPYGVQRVYLPTRHRVLSTVSVPTSSGPGLSIAISFQPLFVQLLLLVFNLGSRCLPVYAQPYAFVVYVSDLTEHCAWLVWFLERMAYTNTYFGAFGWHLGAAGGPLGRNLALRPTSPAQIMPCIIDPVSI